MSVLDSADIRTAAVRTGPLAGSVRTVRRLVGLIARPPLVALVLIVAFWWWFSIGKPNYLLPSPLVVVDRFWQLVFVTRELWGALALSLAALVIGGGLSFIVGVPLGVVMGANPRVENVVGPYINAFYVAPVSALAPLFVFLLGIDLPPRIATVFVFCAPVIILTCYRGALETPRTMVEVARVFGASDLQLFRKTIVPHSIPYIVTASRLGLGRAIKGTVLAELVIQSTGLGELISGYSQHFNTPSIIATLLFLLLLGVAATTLMGRFEVAITPWRQTS